ncbi:nuclear transport factor 2 family protein [Candidatus Woesearchaeota archaeon]|nr:nuclear transport factor 2 family protein [Candidatus Woesearchaeota archaeon]
MNKKIALDFLNMVVSGKIDEAYEKYVYMNGKHHNIYFAAGFSALKEAMKENHEKFPNKYLAVKNVLEDENMVAVHSSLKFDSNSPEMIVVHLFRMEEDKIIEMWDCGQEIPKYSLNIDGAF